MILVSSNSYYSNYYYRVTSHKVRFLYVTYHLSLEDHGAQAQKKWKMLSNAKVKLIDNKHKNGGFWWDCKYKNLIKPNIYKMLIFVNITKPYINNCLISYDIIRLGHNSIKRSHRGATSVQFSFENCVQQSCPSLY